MPKPTLAVVVLFACSGGDRKPPATPVEPAGPPPSAEPVADGELCARVAGEYQARLSTQPDVDAALTAKLVAVVADHCARWPVDTQRCLATRPPDDQSACFEALDPELANAFVADVSAALQPMMAQMMPASCVSAAAAIERWVALPPDAGLTDIDTQFIGASLRAVITSDCDGAPWPDDIKRCAATSETPAACLDKISATKRGELDARLAPRVALFTAAAAQTDGKDVDCPHAVTAHYGDKQWKGKLAATKSGARKKAISAARSKMLEACNGNRWTTFLRACVVSAKSELERTWCLNGPEWGYPPDERARSTKGIAECDEYRAVLAKADGCDKIPEDAQRMFREAADVADMPFIGVPYAEQPAACRNAAKAMKESLVGLGCPV